MKLCCLCQKPLPVSRSRFCCNRHARIWHLNRLAVERAIRLGQIIPQDTLKKMGRAIGTHPYFCDPNHPQHGELVELERGLNSLWATVEDRLDI